MKPKYRMFRRGQVFWCQDNYSGRQESLQTKERAVAERLLHARNEAHQQPIINLQIARAYLLVSDPRIGKRSWQDVMDEMVKLKHGVTRLRWERAAKERPLDLIRNTVIIETHAAQFLNVLKTGTVSTNVHLRKLHNFCLDMSWLPVPVLPKKRWPKVRFKAKRAITLPEHQTILRAEQNPERRAFYALAWHLGASQSDIAALTTENIDWANRTIRFFRRKTRRVAILRFSDDAAEILQGLPQHGLLFPNFSQLREAHRATEFKRACRRLCIEGVTLHSYRYAWAERAKTCGYPERFAQTALGHNSRAVHKAYAGAARPICPALDDYERGMKEKVIPLKAMAERASKAAGAQG